MKRIAVLILVLLCMCGCQRYKELDEMQIVAGLAIDYMDGENLSLTAETIAFQDGKPTAVCYRTEGVSVGDCMTKLLAICGKELYLSHAETIIISKAYAEQGIQDLLDFILRNHELRLTVAVVVAEEGEAAKFLETDETEVLIRSYELANLLKNALYTGLSVNQASYQTIGELYDVSEATVLPMVRLDGERIQVAGCAILQKDVMVGQLSPEQTLFFNLLRDAYHSGTFRVPTEDDFATVEVKQCNTSIFCDVLDRVPRYTAKVSLTVEIQNARYDEEIELAVAKYLRDGTHALYDTIQTMDADVLGFARILRGQHPEQFRNADAQELFAESSLDFYVRVELYGDTHDLMRGET